MVKQPKRALLLALALGWVFDFLFWEKAPGISFAIFVTLCITAGLVLARWEGIRPAPRSLWLLVPIAFFAVMSFVRLEPMTVFLDVAVTLLLMGVLAATLVGGRWMKYSLSDYVSRLLGVTGGALTQTGVALTVRREEEGEKSGQPRKHVWGVLRGLILALPVVLIFASLLTSADPIFSKEVQEFLEIFKIENLAEYLWRTFIILVLAYLLGGVFLHALTKSDDEKLLGLDKPWLSPFLGFTEATVVLGSVVVLFSAFVVVQFRYFFGGNANVHIDGFTFAEYARRGFGEMVVVAFFSLLLFLGLSAVVKRTERGQQKAFSWLGILLVLLVGVILASAFQRLFLYESAYGFSRLRTYPHVFMVWLGLLLVAVVILELIGHRRAFALAALAAALGFILTLNLLNVDAFITRANIDRIMDGRAEQASSVSRLNVPLDATYLASLSPDAALALMDAFDVVAAQGQKEQLDAVGLALACHVALNGEYAPEKHWQSFNLSRWWARRSWEPLKASPEMAPYLPNQDGHGNWYVLIGSEVQKCLGRYSFD